MINGLNPVSAWAGAARLLIETPHPDYMMLVRAGADWLADAAACRVFDAAAKSVGAETPTSVANMLFPRVVLDHEGAASEAIEAGWRFFARGRRRGLTYSGWQQTYFERLTGSWIDRHGVLHNFKENRLLHVVQKLQQWDTNPSAALYAHIDSPADTLRTRGGPCLQYVQFRGHGSREVEIVALYRAHDYYHKALGNMVGLDRLGRFVASQSGRHFSGISVISLNPFSQGGKGALAKYAESLA